MSKHTPGPWRWWETACGARVAGRPDDGSKNFVCDVLPPENAVSYADNARLIASAPDLLEACELFAEWLRREDEGFDHETHDRDTREGEAAWREWFYGNLELCGEAQDKARAAIQKAKGES